MVSNEKVNDKGKGYSSSSVCLFMKTKLNTYIIYEYVFKPVEVFKTPGNDIIFSVLRYVL